MRNTNLFHIDVPRTMHQCCCFGEHKSESSWECLKPSIRFWEEETEMAPHSSILAWKIPWAEEPVRLPSMGSQRVEYDWAIARKQHLKPSVGMQGVRVSLTLLKIDWPPDPGSSTMLVRNRTYLFWRKKEFAASFGIFIVSFLEQT